MLGLNPGSERHSSDLASAVWDDSRRGAARPTLQVPSTAADYADGADAKATSNRHQP